MWGIDSIGFLIFLLFITYSITRHHLFNIKVIAIELVTFSLWIFILIRTLLATNSREFAIGGTLLVITVIFVILLVRSVLHEMSQREQIEKLEAELRAAYRHVEELGG